MCDGRPGIVALYLGHGPVAGCIHFVLDGPYRFLLPSGQPGSSAVLPSGKPGQPVSPGHASGVAGAIPDSESMSQPAQPIRILVVDDDEEVATLLQSVLASHDYQVEVANDLLALQASREQLPDLILLDLFMPTMSGDETVRHLHEMPDTWDIPIVLMSAAGDLPRRADELGVAAYLSKPFDLDELLAVVQRALAVPR